MRTVEKLKDTPIPINKSINARAVTISALSIGIFVIPTIIFLVLFFILTIVIHASVPRTVAITADNSAITIVVLKAFIIVTFSKKSLYQ